MNILTGSGVSASHNFGTAEQVKVYVVTTTYLYGIKEMKMILKFCSPMLTLVCNELIYGFNRVNGDGSE